MLPSAKMMWQVPQGAGERCYEHDVLAPTKHSVSNVTELLPQFSDPRPGTHIFVGHTQGQHVWNVHLPFIVPYDERRSSRISSALLQIHWTTTHQPRSREHISFLKLVKVPREKLFLLISVTGPSAKARSYNAPQNIFLMRWHDETQSAIPSASLAEIKW
jgi:hypothetical protein